MRSITLGLILLLALIATVSSASVSDSSSSRVSESSSVSSYSPALQTIGRLKQRVEEAARAVIQAKKNDKKTTGKDSKKQTKKDKKNAKTVMKLVDASKGQNVQVAGVTGSPVFSCIIETLHPTQAAVGYIAVKQKRETIQKKIKKDQFDDYLKEKPIPVVLGPSDTFYLIDHHHLSRALYEEKIKHGLCTQLVDWSSKSVSDFWKAMDEKKWVFLNDETGKPIQPSQLPNHVAKLVDNPYRSLAGSVREAGGYIQTSTPFAEFFWADFFRKYFTVDEVNKKFEKTVKKAVELAKTTPAKGLPGYAGL